MSAGWRVLLADSQEITRRAVSTVLRSTSDCAEVMEWPEDQSAWEYRPHLVLVDIHSPGLPRVAESKRRFPGAKTVALAGYEEPETVLDALRAGADGFVVKGMLPEELLWCLRCVMHTGMVVVSPLLRAALGEPKGRVPEDHLRSPQVARSERSVELFGGLPATIPDLRKVAPPDVMHLLTLREREVFALLAQNMSNKEIAHALCIAEPTVKAHVSHILAKLGQPNRAQAVIRGVRYVMLNGEGH